MQVITHILKYISLMKNQIAALVFLVIGTFSFAGDGIPYANILDPDNEQPKHLIANRALMEYKCCITINGK